MTEDLQRIRRYVRGLVRRERLLIGARIAIHGVALLVLLVVALQVAAWLRWDRAVALSSLVLATGVAAWWVVAWPLLTRWVPAGDRRRQARLVETHEPDLRGRLITAVDRTDGPAPSESAALLALTARRAARVIDAVPARRVHSARRVVAQAILVALATLVALPASFLITGGPGGTWRWWTGGATAQAAVSAPAADLQAELARVGDLLVRYTYPSYTGLEPKEVPNSTGDVAAPPGTQVEVRARTAEPVEAVGLVAYDQRLDAAVDDDGRQVTARFTVQGEPGTYHLELYRGGEPEPSRDFGIVPQEDLPPEVTLDVSEPLEVAVDGELSLTWLARDDYGVRKATLLVDEREAAELSAPDQRRAEVGGVAYKTPLALGLKAGDTVELVVEAWDNDTWSGSKAGRSRPVKLVVLGVDGLERRAAARQEELKRALIPVLASMLIDPWPPGDRAGDVAAWGEEVGGRYAPLSALLESLDAEGALGEATLLAPVVEGGQALVRYTQVAFEPNAVEAPPREALATAGELRDDAIVALEDALYMLVRMARNRALSDLVQRTQSIEEVAAEMERMLSADDVDAQALLSRVEQLEQLMAELAELAQQLDRGGLQEFVNGRTSEMSSLLDEIRDALAEGDLDEARELMERLAQQLGELSRGVEENLQQQAAEADESMQQAEDLIEDLAELEQDQRALQEQVTQLREQQDDASREAADQLWKQVVAEAEAVVAKGEAYSEALAAARRAFYEIERTAAAIEGSGRLLQSARARDLRGTRSALHGVEYDWDLVYRSALNEEQLGRSAGPPSVRVARLRGHLERIRALLDELEQVSQSTDPTTRERARDLESRQRELDNRLQEVRERAEQVSQEFPVEPRGMDEALEDAEARMEQASDDLGDGRPMEAEGSQGVAAERVREAREAMERAQQQAAQQAAQLQQPGQRQQGGEGERRGDQMESQPRVEIPSREEFRTPEEYRRALLEGMEGDVPEQYRALKRRYYEELVHQ